MTEPPPDRYKRPFLVQLTLAESDLLERAGSRHGTKRKAVVEGLRLLESGELDALRGRVADLERERDTAAAEARNASATQSADAQSARAELKQASGQLREERAALRSARAELRTARQDLAGTRKELASVQTEAHRLAARVPHHAFCGACGRYVPDAEWAEQVDPKGGVHVYHRPHGFRQRGTLGQGASALFWRAKPGETGT